MGKGAGVGAEPGVRGAREMERLNPRVPLLQWSNGTGGARLQEKGEGKGRGGGGANEARKETEGNGKGNNGENGKPKKGIATRAKATAKPSQGASTQEATKQEGGGERHNDEEEESIPPPFMPPLPRFILESRAKVLGSKVVELERDDQEGKKQRRTKRLLEQTMADLREAGGGSDNRRHFAMVNSAKKKIKKLEAGLQRAHEEIEEAAGRVAEALESEKKAQASAQRLTRLLENEKSRHAYLAMQTAQEATEKVRGFDGLRDAVEGMRLVLQQASRQDAVPLLDRFHTVAHWLDPQSYSETTDPLVLGLEVSEEDSEEEEGEGSSEDGGMEYNEGPVQRGKKRQWGEGRWSTAEERDRSGYEAAIARTKSGDADAGVAKGRHGRTPSDATSSSSGESGTHVEEGGRGGGGSNCQHRR